MTSQFFVTKMKCSFQRRRLIPDLVNYRRRLAFLSLKCRKNLLAYIYNLFVSQKTRMYAEQLLHLTGKFTFPLIITATCHETLVVHDQTAIHTC